MCGIELDYGLADIRRPKLCTTAMPPSKEEIITRAHIPPHRPLRDIRLVDAIVMMGCRPERQHDDHHRRQRKKP